MAYYYYLKDKKNKVIIMIGNHKTQKDFERDLEEWRGFIEFANDNWEILQELREKGVDKLTVEDLTLVGNLIKVLPYPEFNSRLNSIFHVLNNHLGKTDYEIIGENELDKVSDDYKIIEEYW